MLQGWNITPIFFTWELNGYGIQNCELFLVKVVNKSFITFSKAHFSSFEYFKVKFCYSLIYGLYFAKLS